MEKSTISTFHFIHFPPDSDFFKALCPACVLPPALAFILSVVGSVKHTDTEQTVNHLKPPTHRGNCGYQLKPEFRGHV